MRHAKSGWPDAVADHDRPLAPRGEQAAPVMGRHMARQGLIPDHVLCSTARRALETLALVVAAWEVRPPIETDRRLYLATRRTLLERLAAAPGTAARLLLVGHNPGLHELAVGLAAAGDPAMLAALREKLPTAGLAVIELAIEGWPGLVEARGRLVDFVVPKDLL